MAPNVEPACHLNRAKALGSKGSIIVHGPGPRCFKIENWVQRVGVWVLLVRSGEDLSHLVVVGAAEYLQAASVAAWRSDLLLSWY
ncbi:hypothetical protein AMTR_s00131p00034200 [Amborella trichopoda]|uniref:Uncharacterized protein n=1 Tax=Amborella trichopoda TaxID=13333 RepID=W1NR21_AMBTC|nr:hypothetical protein AMTR_s00131p00034200 [Amborella trichopoda]